MHETIGDETLMAYVDGELPEDERRSVAEAVARDPGLRARMQLFERTGRAAMAPAFEAAERPVPAFLRADAYRAAPGRSIGVRTRGALVSAMAAALMAVGFSLGAYWSGAASGGSDGDFIAARDGLEAAGALRAALETRASGGFAPDDGGAPAVVQSFAAADGRFCREYVLISGGGVACRMADGRWIVALHARSPGAADGGYAPAGDESRELIDGFVHQIMLGEPLSREAEQDAIAKGWRK